jgi:trigger factor
MADNDITQADDMQDTEGTDEITFVEDPEFTIDYKGECAYEVGVVIPVANEKKQADEMFDELKHDAEVPGFRRGRAPRKLIERKFSRVVKDEVAGKLVNMAFQKLIKDNDLRPIYLPDIDGLDEMKDRPADQPLSLTFKFEVSPRVELGKYREIEIERPVLEVLDKDVEQAIEDMRGRYAVYETVEDGVVQDGDQAVISFKGTVDGEAFPGGSADNYPYVIGSKRFFPEFEAALVGAAQGAEVSCTVVFPEDYFSEDLRGKSADFTITVGEIKRRQLPAVDDEFAKKAGFESVDDMNEKVRARLVESAASQSNDIAEMRALDKVMEASTFEIPKTLVERSAHEAHQDEVRRLLSNRVPMAHIQERDAEIQAQAREHAIRDIKRVVLLNEIGEAEGVEVTDEDFDLELQSAAARLGLDAGMLGGYIGEDEDRRSQYEERIFRTKAMKVIMDNAAVKDVPLSREELDKQLKDESGESEA